jgi:CheY-like chemotaxis protein
MSRILLADDSPHAQRMGERILRDEGHEVITVSDGRVALLRLADASPDVIIADVSMPEVSGYELCEYVKGHGGEPVLLTAGAVEPVDEKAVERVKADGLLKKPFEASALLEAVSRFGGKSGRTKSTPQPAGAPTMRSVVVIEPDQIRAAITVALDAAMPAMIDQITDRVVAALSGRKSGVAKAASNSAAAPAAAAPQTATPHEKPQTTPEEKAPAVAQEKAPGALQEKK